MVQKIVIGTRNTVSVAPPSPETLLVIVGANPAPSEVWNILIDNQNNGYSAYAFSGYGAGAERGWAVDEINPIAGTVRVRVALFDTPTNAVPTQLGRYYVFISYIGADGEALFQMGAFDVVPPAPTLTATSIQGASMPTIRLSVS